MKKTKTVLILAAVTGALLLGGCGSEKTKIYEQAGKDLSQGSYKYALEEYQSSIQNGVKLAQSYRGAGIASLRLGKYEDAVNSFTEALNCDKVSKSLRKDILSYRATAELKSGKYEDAMADCQTLGEDFSMDAGSYFLTGKVALAMDSYEEAASNFKQAYGEDSTFFCGLLSLFRFSCTRIQTSSEIIASCFPLTEMISLGFFLISSEFVRLLYTIIP